MIVMESKINSLETKLLYFFLTQFIFVILEQTIFVLMWIKSDNSKG